MVRSSNAEVDFGELVNTSGSQRMLSHKVVMYLAVAARSDSDSEVQVLLEKIQMVKVLNISLLFKLKKLLRFILRYQM